MGRDSLLVRVVAAVVLVLSGWFFWHRWGLADTAAAQPPAVAGAEDPGGASPAEGTGAAGLTAGTPDGQAGGQAAQAHLPPIVVHVAGAVLQPGVYELPDGARVHEAVLAAGGAAPEADTDQLNLAAVLADGQKVYVPREGEQVVTDGGGGAGGSATPQAVVSINRASAQELEALPGIGPVLAGRIVTYRTANGPFRSVDDLLNVSGIGPKLLEQLRPHVRL